MNLESMLKDNTIEDFTCDLCYNVLSYFPIYLSSDCQNVCGRCTPPKGNLHFRNKIFENISKFVKFPCRYKNRGCVEELLPEQVPDHENVCQFRTIRCCLLKCKWQGPNPDFLDHCNDKHSEMFLVENETFDVNLSTSFHLTKLLKNNDMLIVNEMKFNLDEKRIQIALYHPKHVKTGLDLKYSYELCLKTETMKLLARVETASFDDTSFTDVNVAFKEQVVKCMIGLEKPYRDLEVEKQLNDYLLSTLQCSFCNEFALPPIFQCSLDKIVLCSSCKKNHTNCANCGLDQVKNVALDKMADLLNYPCKYKTLGCVFVDVPAEMTKHVEICQYKTVTCPLLEFVECVWEGYGKHIGTHLQNEHHILIPTGSEFSGTFSLLTGFSILKRGNSLFLLSYGINKSTYYWAVQTLHGESDKVFEHQIEIFTPDLPDKLLFRRPCSGVDYNVNVGEISNARFKIRVL